MFGWFGKSTRCKRRISLTSIERCLADICPGTRRGHKNLICAISSLYKIISYLMIFVRNDRFKLMCAYWSIYLSIVVGPMLRLGCLRKLCENCRKHLWFMVKDKMSQKIFKGAMINDISAIWSSYKMIAYVMIFVHNDRLRTVHDDIQTVKIDIL